LALFESIVEAEVRPGGFPYVPSYQNVRLATEVAQIRQECWFQLLINRGLWEPKVQQNILTSAQVRTSWISDAPECAPLNHT